MSGSTLGELLELHVQAEVARRLGVPRAYVWRLRWGQPLHDDALIAPLAQLLRVPVETLEQIVKNDRSRSRRSRRATRKAAA